MVPLPPPPQVVVKVPTFEVSLTTSNDDIPYGVVQVNELVYINGVITLPEVLLG